MGTDYKKNVGFVGGLSLLISSVTGPGIITIPLMFQAAGWVFPTICFIVIAFLSGLGSLFLLESMTYFPGNDKFQLNVEFTVLVHQFYGRRWYYLMHVIMYGSLQSFNIASIISAIQSFDYFLISLFGSTCGYGIKPISGFYCVSVTTNTNSPFGSNYMLFSLGFILLLILVMPLISLDLNDNMIVQCISVAYLLFIVLIWIIISSVSGLKAENMPPVGTSMLSVLGNVMFNYTLANTVPSWVNTKHKSVPIKKTIWYSIWSATFIYLLVGWFGGAAFPMLNSNLLSAISSSPNVSTTALKVNDFIAITYPILILLTSIPVSMIIVRLNLVSSKICSKGWATFWATILPFLVAIPFQTGNWVNLFANWTSLVFQSVCNFVAPFCVYLFLHKRNTVMQQSVIDELEFLELDGNLRKYREDDDDFDYTYHLPYADLERLGVKRYNPFSPSQNSLNAAGGPLGGGVRPTTHGPNITLNPNNPTISTSIVIAPSEGSGAGMSTSGLSTVSGAQNRRALMRQMLGPQRRAPGSHGTSASRMNLGDSRRESFTGGRAPSFTPAGFRESRASNLNPGGFSLAVPGMGPGIDRSRMGGLGMFPAISMGGLNANKVYPITDSEDVESMKRSVGGSIVPSRRGSGIESLMKPKDYVEDVTGQLGHFKAMPNWVMQRVHPNYVAFIAFILLLIAVVVVGALDILMILEEGLEV